MSDLNISAAMVADLRKETGVAMMDCKKALIEAKGDKELAIDILRKKGIASAQKKEGRVAAEGVVTIKLSDDKKTAAILEVNSETDFVARDENFNNFTQTAINAALANQCDSIPALAAVKTDNGQTIEDLRLALIAKIGENISLRRIALVKTNGVLGSYTHGSRIGVVVNLSAGDEELAKDIAMHIAAAKPIVVSPEEVSKELLDKEKEIYTAQAEQSGKPAAIIEKMVEGRLKKYLDEVSLLGQPFVKNPDLTIAKLLESKKAKVDSFTCYIVGEGIEKKVVDFAEEVYAQARGA